MPVETCIIKNPETVSETVYSILPDAAPVISMGYGADQVKFQPFTPSTGVKLFRVRFADPNPVRRKIALYVWDFVWDLGEKGTPCGH